MGYLLLRIFVFLITLSTIKVFAQDAVVEKKCIDCHTKVTSKKIKHKPVAEGCDKCHISNGQKHPQEDVEGFVLTKKIPLLCFSCHKNQYKESSVHKPVGEGDCLSCHPAHSADEAHLTALPSPKQCYFCHTELKDTVSKASVLHGAMNDSLSCLVCHSPHASSQKKILLLEEKALCFSCHDKPVKKEARVIPDMKKYIEKNKYVHGAIDNNGCVICHDPHAAKNEKLLVSSFPPGNYAGGRKENYKLCFASCHETTLIEDSLTKETGFRNGNVNLHYLHVTKEKGRSCENCHDAHASNNLYLLADKVKFGSWQMPVGFKRIEKGGTCAPGCHSEKTYRK
jgi:predicted CXXCH cytochrome family protein